MSIHSRYKRGLFSRTILLPLTLLLACSSASPEPPKDVIEAVPFQSTIMLTADDLLALEPETGDGLLLFRSIPPALAPVKRGSVIVGSVAPSAPMGLMRIVRAVTPEGAGLKLDTLNAPIQIAFKRVHIAIQPRTTGLLSALPGTRAGLSRHSLQSRNRAADVASASIAVDIYLFDGDGDTETKDDQVELRGTIEGSVTLGFNLDFDWGFTEDALPNAAVSCLESILLGPELCLLALVPEAKVEMAADARLEAKAALTGAAIADFQKEFDLLDVTLDPIAIYPVPIIPVVTVVATIEGSASALFSADVHAGLDVISGVALSSKHLDTPMPENPRIENLSIGADPPSVTLGAQLKASLGAQTSILVAGVVGPFARADLFAQLDADLTRDPCWNLNAGVDSYLGLTIKPTLPLVGSITLFDWKAEPFSLSWPISNGHCFPEPTASMLPPGAGPDAMHFAMPTFTPWSRLISEPLDGSFSASPTGDGLDWTSLLRTIDDRYLVTGSAMANPLKIDASVPVLKWSKAYFRGDFSGPQLTVRRAVQEGDATLRFLANTPTDVLSFGVLSAAQSGAVSGYRLLTPGDPGCAPTPIAFASDGALGVYVAGTCSDLRRGFVARLSESGAVLFSMTIADPMDTVVPTTLVPVQGEVVLAGRVEGADDRMFVIRLDQTGAPRFSSAYHGCSDAHDVSPTAGIADPNGEVTLVGSASAHHVGFLGRLHTDGSVAFASFPGISLGAGEVLVINDLLELPETGYVVAGSTVDLTGAAPFDTAATAIVGLDAIGHARWSRRMTLLDAGQPVASGFPGLALSDDGGFVVASAAQAMGGAIGGRLWVTKVVAKDGTVSGLDPTRAEVDDLGLRDQQCDLSAAPFRPALASMAMTSSAAAAVSRPENLRVDRLTP